MKDPVQKKIFKELALKYNMSTREVEYYLKNYYKIIMTKMSSGSYLRLQLLNLGTITSTPKLCINQMKRLATLQEYLKIRMGDAQISRYIRKYEDVIRNMHQRVYLDKGLMFKKKNLNRREKLRHNSKHN
jgi:hypothetical protein